MSDCSENKNPLQRSGTSQMQRQLPGLSSGYVKVDENGFDNWIVFAAQFALFVKYIDRNDMPAGDWAPFFNSDISALLGSIGVQNINIYKIEIKKRIDFLKDNENSADTPALKRNLSELFAGVVTLAKAMDQYLVRLTAYNALNKANGNLKQQINLQGTLLNLIKTRLAPAFQRLLAYYKAATETLGYLSGGGVSSWEVLNTQVVAAETIINGEGLTRDWWIFKPDVLDPDKSWSNYLATIHASDGESIFKAPFLSTNFTINSTDPDTIFKRINHAANHNLFASVFEQFLMGYSRFIAEAEKELLKTLEAWDNHQPHYALFLAFLKLFRLAQDSMNTLTQRHLDYYYKEVLQILPFEAVPNHAHILVELAKQTDSWGLAKQELFKAGKDEAGKDILYALDKDETFNKASVAAFKSVYFGTDKDGHPLSPPAATPLVVNTGRLFASPVSNSADGLGEDLTSDSKEWHPFVNKIYAEGKLADIAMPNAQIGFAIASHHLYLTEGSRTITVQLQTTDNDSKTKTNELLLLRNQISCWLTAEKGWYEVTASPNITQVKNEQDRYWTNISFTLPGNSPAIVNYQAKVHGGTFGCTVPVLKVLLKNDDGSPYSDASLRNVLVEKVELKVAVGMGASTWNQDGLKALLLSNDAGPLDAAKPFAPFGAQPKRETTFAIGHPEPFSKKNSAIRLHLEWADLPASANNIRYTHPIGTGTNQEDNVADAPGAKLQFLAGGKWGGSSTETIFNGITPQVVLFGTAKQVPAEAITDIASANKPYDTQSRAGFMRLVLDNNFGHKDYMTDLSLYMIEKSRRITTTLKQPVEPYSPILQSVYLSYEAKVDSNLANAQDASQFDVRGLQFFHLAPFGEAEVHARLLKDEQTATNVYLLPQFAHTAKDTTRVQHLGEFYIGLQHLEPLQSVSLLFQVLEGSADPLLPKPVKHVHWSYLGQNQWHDFASQDISDGTRQLVQSGIINFAIPADAGTNHTLLPSGYLWLRASISEYAEAVCAMLNVHTQAALVTMRPNNNSDSVLNNALPAESIGKLKVPAAAVKKVLQPYPSFGGKGKETGQQFYMRVSERLRHKARAITIWDYEHLVLQAFPQIHKAKCLNHTQFAIKPGQTMPHYNEVQPGYVTLITIPNLVNRNDVNPLKPYTNQSLLLEIKEFLRQKISCHVQLEVTNPSFEEVRFSFALQLAAGYTDFTYYSKQLQQEIVAYLTPWAYSNQAEVQFGGKVYKSSLINFIEERGYVDFLTDVKMFHITADGKTESGDLDEITASTAKSILVSTQASAHIIIPASIKQQQSTKKCKPVN